MKWLNVSRAGCVAPLVEYLASRQEAPGSITSIADTRHEEES